MDEFSQFSQRIRIMKCSHCHESMVENSPWIACLVCQNKFCPGCSDMSPDLCHSIRERKECSWKCLLCEGSGQAKTDETQSVQSQSLMTLLEAMNERMKKDNEKIFASLKSFESVVKKVDVIEEKQTAQEEKLTDHEEILGKQAEKIKDLEERENQNIDVNHLVDKAATEMAEREKRSRNFLVHQMPESLFTDPDKILNDDRQKVEKLVADVMPKVQVVRLFRIGQPRQDSQKPRSLLVNTTDANQARAVVNASFAKTLTKIPGTKDIQCTKDRSFNQRLVLGKTKVADVEHSRGRGRGQTRGRGRGRPRGRGSRNASQPQEDRERSDSRKRQRESEAAEPAPITKKNRADPSSQSSSSSQPSSGSQPSSPQISQEGQDVDGNGQASQNDAPAQPDKASSVEEPAQNEIPSIV